MSVVWKYTPPKVNAITKLAAAIPVATHAGAEHLLAAAEQLVPVDTGALKASGEVIQDGADAHVRFSAIAADGYDYSIRQHQELQFHHEHGQALYLEQPMHTERDAVAKVVATELRKAIGL